MWGKDCAQGLSQRQPRWSAHPVDGAECRVQAQDPAFSPDPGFCSWLFRSGSWLFCFVFWCFLSCCPLLAPTAHFFWSLVVAFYSVAWGGCVQIQTQPQRVPGRRLVSRVWVMVTTSVCFFFQVISRLSNKSTVSQVWLFAKEQNIYLKFVGFPTNLFPPWRFFVFTFDFP